MIDATSDLHTLGQTLQLVSHTKKKKKNGWILPPCQWKLILPGPATLNYMKSQADSAPFVPLKYVALDIEKVGLQTPLINDCFFSAVKFAIVDEKGDRVYTARVRVNPARVKTTRKAEKILGIPIRELDSLEDTWR